MNIPTTAPSTPEQRAAAMAAHSRRTRLLSLAGSVVITFGLLAANLGLAEHYGAGTAPAASVAPAAQAGTVQIAARHGIVAA